MCQKRRLFLRAEIQTCRWAAHAPRTFLPLLFPGSTRPREHLRLDRESKLRASHHHRWAYHLKLLGPSRAGRGDPGEPKLLQAHYQDLSQQGARRMILSPLAGHITDLGKPE